MTPFEFGQFVKQSVGPQPAPTPAGQTRTPELIAKLRQQGINSGSWTSTPGGFVQNATKPTAKPPAAVAKPAVPVPATTPKVQRNRGAF
jgi:hypothetical protein